MEQFINIDTVGYFTTLAAGAIFLVAFYYGVCRPVAWHLILYRNQERFPFVPAGVVFRPNRTDRSLVARLIFGLSLSMAIFIISISRLDLEVVLMVWDRFVNDTITPVDSYSFAAALSVFLSGWFALTVLVSLVRKRGRVDWIMPDPQTVTKSEVKVTKPPSLHVID